MHLATRLRKPFKLLLPAQRPLPLRIQTRDQWPVRPAAIVIVLESSTVRSCCFRAPRRDDIGRVRWTKTPPRVIHPLPHGLASHLCFHCPSHLTRPATSSPSPSPVSVIHLLATIMSFTASPSDKKGVCVCVWRLVQNPEPHTRTHTPDTPEYGLARFISQSFLSAVDSTCFKLTQAVLLYHPQTTIAVLLSALFLVLS
ncbi:hypothetical protein BD289DRAFT_228126 [Coniella lustricola]|uniref:Uncharacterized protein n=1 Tax=Coniella lustricola TaxID=2025994 RepID=A0A2T3AAN3_9PEZI|nr:hypothetical protein BD289DRAFT_228126 [Coniella lustricola]